VRSRASLVSQLLVAFAVFAVLIGVAAIFGYAGVTRQNSTAKLLTGHDYLLQHEAGLMQVEFDVAQAAVNGYALSGRKTFLLPLRSQQTAYASNVAALRTLSAKHLQGFVTQQQQAGAQLFAIADQVTHLAQRSAQAQALASGIPSIAGKFYLANYEFQESVGGDFGQLTDQSSHALSVGLAWSAVAIGVAVLLVLAASLSTLRTITRPLRALTATVRRLTAGDLAARAVVAGSAEVREVAQSVNAQADEADRLRAQEAEHKRLRAMAREVGLRIREHLVADEVLLEAQTAVEQNLHADVTYLHLVDDGRLGDRIGGESDQALPAGHAAGHVPPDTLSWLHDLFRAQRSLVIRDAQGADAEKLATLYSSGLPDVAPPGGPLSLLITPFGVGSQLLGTITARRRTAGHAWTPAEVDAVESIAADLGRGLNQARLYEAENRLVVDLQALDAAKSDFFAMVSHELGSPLTTIEGYLEILSDDDAEPVTQQQAAMLATIDRSVVRLRTLIDDVFTLAKLESSASALIMRPVNMADVITGAVAAVHPMADAGQLTLTWSEPAADLVVSGDAGQLERMVINLLSNAVKYTPEGGQVEVTAAADHDSAVIRVRDTGIGIPARDQAKLFTRFYRASNAIDRKIPGTGLGLAIIRTIVTSHGGELSLESRENEGTTITVHLPLQVPAVLLSPARPPQLRSCGLSIQARVRPAFMGAGFRSALKQRKGQPPVRRRSWCLDWPAYRSARQGKQAETPPCRPTRSGANTSRAGSRHYW
jgi:two-component system phosphate regulon sensor histidine kinase PhoR